MQSDRRRLNPPAGGTAPPIFEYPSQITRPTRTRQADEHRKIFLRTGVVPSASGSAYYETSPQDTSSKSQDSNSLLIPLTSSLKIICTVHGPRPLPRNAAFSPNLLLTTHIKFAPFATRVRRGYIRDASERDLAQHLETALRGVVIGERWPKSGCEVVVTILEGEEDGFPDLRDVDSGKKRSGWGLMSVLAGCITVASAALCDAGIDCVDLLSGGVAALVERKSAADESGKEHVEFVLDPAPPEEQIRAACVVGYLHSRDEISEMWMKGDAGVESEKLIDSAVKAAVLTRTVLAEAVRESAELKLKKMPVAANGGPPDAAAKGKGRDVRMTG
ncbi:Exosome complex component MTR3 [Cercospora zeina]